MKRIDIDRINLKKYSLGENPLTLKRIDYPEVVHNGTNLLDDNGNPIGTKGDMYAKIIMDNILQNGALDYNPRPHYEDLYEDAIYDEERNIVITSDGKEIQVGEKETVKVKDNGVEIWVPAHTISVNQGVECTYDLSREESPMITLRPIAIKSTIAEIFWIYQRESNDLVEFDELLGKNTWNIDGKISNWWRDWALKDKDENYILNEKGHPIIGSCYGETVEKHNLFKGQVIDAIKSNMDGRRNICCLWQEDDFKEPHGLKPCAFLTIWNVRHEWDGKDYLDMTMVQRSSDFATAGCINQVQYVALQKMVARELGIEAGMFTWKPVNVQLYDRHIKGAIEMLNREPVNCSATVELNKDVESFYDFEPSDVTIHDYPLEYIKKENPQIKFPLGI